MTVSLRNINILLTGFFMLLLLYISIAPFLPNLMQPLARVADETNGYRYESQSVRDAVGRGDTGIDVTALEPVPLDNRLVIPSIGVDVSISEGLTPEALFEGVWRRPRSSTPADGGNTVITGHRFFPASNANYFYHLDKVPDGAELIVFWEGEEYRYRVSTREVVPPERVSVESPTDHAQLTIYTCTPLLTAENRLVLTAHKIN